MIFKNCFLIFEVYTTIIYLNMRSFMYKLRIIYQLNNSSLWLTLRNNSLAGFEIISSHLGKLENLDLSYNTFNDSSFSHLCGLSSLKSFDLSYNGLTGSGSFKVLSSRLKKPENLHLSGNQCNDTIFPSLTGSIKYIYISNEQHLINSNYI